MISTAIILVQQNLLSVAGDGDRVILGAVLAALLVFWPHGLVEFWRLRGAAAPALVAPRTAVG